MSNRFNKHDELYRRGYRKTFSIKIFFLSKSSKRQTRKTNRTFQNELFKTMNSHVLKTHHLTLR